MENTFFDDYKSLISSINNMTKSKEGFGYKYVELTPLLEEVLPKVHEHNFILVQTIKQTNGDYCRIITEPAVHEDKKQGVRIIEGNITKEIKTPAFVLNSKLIHKDGNEVSCDLPLYVDDIDPQSFGSAETYARRYSIYTLLHIKTQDDDGAGASPKAKKQQSEKESLPEDVNKIATFLSGLSDPKPYYWDVKNHKTLDEKTKQKIINTIIYPK